MIEIRTPAERFPGLFGVVQRNRVFEDSKTFVDAEPQKSDDEINAAFDRSRREPGFDPRAFVEANFRLPDRADETAAPEPARSIFETIDARWDSLRRDADDESDASSLIPLPHDYIVPGGRFREIYYWDSYFTMLGLAEAGRVELIRHMVDNFAYLIDEIGFVPNGNRSYYCSRSQPPFFALMVALLDEVSDEERVAAGYQPQLLREYAFWMAGADELDEAPGAYRRVVQTPDGPLNRYWDDADEPRQESYAEDLALADRCDREPQALFRDLRAACESGWDFSSRWLADGSSLETIRTTDVVPVDLNVLLFNLERQIAVNFETHSQVDEAAKFRDRAARRSELIRSRFFDDESGAFVDLDRHELLPTGRLSLATAFPLAFGIATDAQAERVAATLERQFLKAGGWVTTTAKTGQQWDAPNGWAPLQWIVYRGLVANGFEQQAAEGARRWLDNNTGVYERSGHLMEKYDVETVGHRAGGGEYDVQEGFGWTNGVFLRLARELADRNRAAISRSR